MKLSCPGCGNSTDVPDHRLPPVGSRGRCGGCGRSYVFSAIGLVDEDVTPVNPTEAVTPPEGTRPIALKPTAGPPKPAAVRQRPAAGAGTEAWFVRTVDGERGPLSLPDVKALIRNHQLHETDGVRTSDTDDWTPAQEVPEIKRFFAIRARAPAAAGSEVDLFSTCHRHPQSQAEWVCSSCNHVLCGECVATKDLGTVRGVKVCAGCGGVCKPMQKAKKITPFWQDWGEVFSFPVRNGAWIGVIIFAVIQTMADVAGIAPGYGTVARTFLMASLFAYLLFILRASSEGKNKLPDMGHVGDWRQEMLWPGIKGMLVSTIVSIPFILYVAIVIPRVGLTRPTEGRVLGVIDPDDPDLNLSAEERAALRQLPGGESNDDDSSSRGSDGDAGAQDFAAMAEREAARKQGDSPSGASHDDDDRSSRKAKEDYGWKGPSLIRTIRPMHLIAFALLSVYALVMLPILWMIVALFNTIRPAFSPPLLFRIMGVIKREYAILVLTIAGLLIAGQLVGGPLLNVGLLAGRPLFNVANAYFYFVMFHVMGRLAHQVSDRLDWY